MKHTKQFMRQTGKRRAWKKHLFFLFAAILLLQCVMFVSCQKMPTIPHTATDYLGNMTIKQETNGYSYCDTKRIGNICYVRYKIGNMENYPISDITTSQYYDGSLRTLTYSSEIITAETVSRKIENSISSSRTTSITSSASETLAWHFDVGVSRTEKAGVGIKAGVLSAETEFSQTVSAEAGMSSSLTIGLESTNSSAIVKAINEGYETTSLRQKAEVVTSEYDMSRYETGYCYKLVLAGEMDVYQIVAFEVDTGRLYATYFVSDIDPEKTYVTMVSSSSNNFEIPDERRLKPLDSIDLSGISIPPEEKRTEKTLSPIQLLYRKTVCRLDNGYDPSDREDDAFRLKLHEGYEIGETSLYGCEKRPNSNQYIVRNKEEFSISLKVTADLWNLPLRAGAHKINISDDPCNRVAGTNISSAVGKGAYWVRICYTDGTIEEYNRCNFLNGQNKDSVIEFVSAEEIDSSRTLSRIEIVFVYEIFAGAPGKIFGIWWKSYANYRCTVNLSF